MNGNIENQFNNSAKKINNDSNMAKQNIYSKIAPPNTFKNRNNNQVAPKIFQRYDKTIQSNQIINPYINYKSNFNKKSFISNSNIIDSYQNSNIKLLNNINSSYRENKVMKGNLFNKNLNNIISPKNAMIQNAKTNINKLESNKKKMKNQYIIKNKSVYIKKGKNNFFNNYNENKINSEFKKVVKFQNNDNVNFKNDENNFIKNKYDYLLKRTQILLSNYQHIIDYYQNKEKEKEKENNQNKEKKE